MTIFALITYIGIALLLLSMLSTSKPYRRLEKPGRVIAAPYFSLFQKMKIYRHRLAAMATVIVLGLIGHWLAPSLAMLVAVFALLILLIPLRCTVTTRGVAFGEAFFIPWNEVRDAVETGGRLDLRHVASLGRFTLALSPAETSRVLAEAHGKG